ncbi:hypothetical protein EPR50_G00031470 [Perca flavescens]|uniref:Uncharacterized protein n=1 Tax=Perca flavescens TaxID=8167 RepID=A0A484DJN8_PERFV|nr:hypothetical protein EPR50_G00031470 [Perca flavescens]
MLLFSNQQAFRLRDESRVEFFKLNVEFIILFQLLEESIVTFVKKELKKFQKVLSPDYPEYLESQREDEKVLDGEDEDEEQRRRSREAFLKITLHFLRRMKQEELADSLQSSKRILTDLKMGHLLMSENMH